LVDPLDVLLVINYLNTNSRQSTLERCKPISIFSDARTDLSKVLAKSSTILFLHCSN